MVSPGVSASSLVRSSLFAFAIATTRSCAATAAQSLASRSRSPISISASAPTIESPATDCASARATCGWCAKYAARAAYFAHQPQVARALAQSGAGDSIVGADAEMLIGDLLRDA